MGGKGVKEPDEERPPIIINWMAAKHILCHVVCEVFYRAEATDRDFRSWWRERELPIDPESLVYELGHYGRGYDDFSPLFRLKAARARETVRSLWSVRPGLVVRIAISDLLEQIAKAAENYAESTTVIKSPRHTRDAPLKERSAGYRTAKERIKALYALASRVRGKGELILWFNSGLYSDFYELDLAKLVMEGGPPKLFKK